MPEPTDGPQFISVLRLWFDALPGWWRVAWAVGALAAVAVSTFVVEAVT
jgi:hypothetical protein